MLKREFKLKSSDEIKQILKLGRACRGKFLSVFTAPGSHDHCRAAVVVSRKVAITAVARNRVRRIIFNDLSERFAAWENRPIGDMVVMVMAIPNDEKLLTADIERCLAV